MGTNGSFRPAAQRGQPPSGESHKDFPLQAVLAGSTEELIAQLWQVNGKAKSLGNGWYEVKTILVQNLLVRLLASPLVPGILSWGVRRDERERKVLYVDLVGYGQFSFHITGIDHATFSRLPSYRYGWIGQPRDDAREHRLAPCRALSILREYRECANHGGWEQGEVHEAIVRAGLGTQYLSELWSS